MSLRNRIVVTLLAITAVLLIPALYGLWSLRELQSVASTLKSRDAEASVALGSLEAALETVQNQERIYVAVPDTSLRTQVETAMRQVRRELRVLEEKGYTGPVRAAEARWRVVEGAIARERELAAPAEATRGAGFQEVLEQAAAFHDSVSAPAIQEMDRALHQVGEAINRQGEAQVDRAQQMARLGTTGTLIALALALALTIAIGTLLTRALLRPIGELRRGMAHVAEGDFEPHVRIPRDRPDELGDLARSFTTMTTQLAELDRLKAEFVSVASHEIKTPLSVIRGYVSLLLDGIYGEVTETQRRTLTSVSDQAERLTRLVHRLLDVTRFEAGGGRLELREIPVRGFLADLTTGFEVLAYQNEIRFEVELDRRLPEFIVGDPERLNEVLGNLLSNAFKFTPKGGRIDLRAVAHAGGVAVEVEDTGVGIPADKLPMIFEKFFQVDNDAQPRSAGSGLGLAIAREIVEAHGGTITAESEPGRGTCFRVTLPQRPPAAAAAAHS